MKELLYLTLVTASIAAATSVLATDRIYDYFSFKNISQNENISGRVVRFEYKYKPSGAGAGPHIAQDFMASTCGLTNYFVQSEPLPDKVGIYFSREGGYKAVAAVYYTDGQEDRVARLQWGEIVDCQMCYPDSRKKVPVCKLLD